MRRLWIAKRCRFGDKPFEAGLDLELDDIVGFLDRPFEDARVSALLRGLALCEMPDELPRGISSRQFVPAGWALLKLVFTRDQTLVRLAKLPPSTHVPVPPELLRRLVVGDTTRAIEIAARRLHASGLPLVLARRNLPSLPRALGARLAASLLPPLSSSATGALLRSLVKSTNESAVVA
jgi:CRISPR-associated protein Csx17